MIQLKIVEYPITKNRKFQLNQIMYPKYLVIHSVGCACEDPYRFADSENNASANACVHAIIGADGTVVHTLGWERKGWHTGNSTSNNCSIGVEMVEPSFITYTGGATWIVNKGHTLEEVKAFAKKTYDTAVELFAKLCAEFKLNPLKDIYSHNELGKLGLGSDHVDPEHIWNKVGLSMDSFRKDVNKRMAFDYVGSLYVALLKRLPDSAGKDTWKDKDISTILEGIMKSEEFRRNYIKLLYKLLLKRKNEPTKSEIDTWINSNQNIYELYNSFINSKEYKNVNK